MHGYGFHDYYLLLSFSYLSMLWMCQFQDVTSGTVFISEYRIHGLLKSIVHLEAEMRGYNS